MNAHYKLVLTLAVLGTIALGARSIARGDVVDPPPASCPPGSTPSSSHSGPYCAPTPECTGDASCGAGSRCTAVDQCVLTRNCGGLMPPDSEPCTLSHVAGACSPGACSADECETRMVCTPASSGTSDGCGCRAAGRGAGARGGLAAMLAVIALAWARRVENTRRR